jgi:hypothetical protein
LDAQSKTSNKSDQTMKKGMLSLLVVLFSAAGVHAQRNTLLVYGTVGAASQKTPESPKASSFTISPAVGYQFNDNWTAGLRLDARHAKTSSDVKSNSVAVGPFIRYAYSLSDIFAVYGQFNADVLSSKTAGVHTNGVGVSFFPAIGVNLKNGFALNFGFGDVHFTSQKPKGSPASTTDFGLSFGSGATFGISKNFGL